MAKKGLSKKKRAQTQRTAEQAKKAVAVNSQRYRTMLNPDATRLEECEQMYVRALANPFDPIIQGKVCYPGFPAKKSVKFVNDSFVTVAVGTGGVGWVMFDLTPSNAAAAIYYTDATYAGTLATAFTKTTGSGVNSTFWNGANTITPFTEAPGASNQYRMVVAGARFRYTGTELNRGGSVYYYANPQQVSVEGVTPGNALVPACIREMAVINEYQTVVVPAMHEEDLEWKDADIVFPWSDGGGTSSKPFVAFIFTGTAGNTFQVRLCEHYEAAGGSFNMFATQSHVGNQQLIQSVGAAAASATYGTPSPTKSYFGQFIDTLGDLSHRPLIRSALNFAISLGSSAIAARVGLPPMALSLPAPRRRR